MIQAWMDMVPMVPMVPTAWQSKVISRFRDCILMEKQVASRLDRDISEGIKCLLNKDWTSRTKYQWVDKLHNSYHIGWVPFLACCLCGLQSLQENTGLKKNVSKKATGQNSGSLNVASSRSCMARAAWWFRSSSVWTSRIPSFFLGSIDGPVTWVTDVKVSY